MSIMGSDDGTQHHAYDSDGDTEYYNGEEEEFEGYGDSENDGEGDGYGFDDITTSREKTYTVLSEADIRQRQERDITALCNVLSVSRESASVLLRYFKWNVAHAQEEWFADEEKVCKAVGFLENPVLQRGKKGELYCRICLEIHPYVNMDAAACGHLFCIECWKGYIGTSITDGPGCLTLRCPDPSCKVAISQDMIGKLACDEDKAKYTRYLVSSYVEAFKNTKWCPAPGCDYAVEFDGDCENYDVNCACSNNFCWNCTEEVHRPVACPTVAKWILKNTDESENTNWILANSKPCPKCHKAIEKNQGCMHMTCTPPCRFEFCWLCLGAWSEHGEKTGGFYACNRWDTNKENDEFEKDRQKAAMYIERYTHYYERWAANHKSREKALADLKKIQAEDIANLVDKQCQPQAQVMFVVDAWQQIVECRRVLKWTYAYGYYLPEKEKAKREMFEYLQGEAESQLERLHNCAEKELQVYLNAKGPSADFSVFHQNLAQLTRVTQNYFENLVKALENGLSEVGARG